MPNDSEVARSQTRIRAEILELRRNLSTEDRRDASAAIADRVLNSNVFRRARNVGCYIATAHEVDTREIILRARAMKKRIFAPVMTKTQRMLFKEVSANGDVCKNSYGIMEPVTGDVIAPKDLDVVLAPCVVFDALGNRIGMGGGYFDRTFAFLRHRRHFFRPKMLGLAFECQKVEKINANPWDIRVFLTITEADKSLD